MTKPPLNTCRIPPQPIWYDMELPSSSFVENETTHVRFHEELESNSIKSSTSSTIVLNESTAINTAYQKGLAFLNEEANLYEKFQAQHNSSQAQMHKLFLKGGTMTDKISVLTLSIQHSPFHNLSLLEKLLGMVSKKNRTEALLALSALKDLFTGTGLTNSNSGLLPSDRKLKPFASHFTPVSNDKETSTSVSSFSLPQLAFFIFEDRLKQLYFQFLMHLEQLLKDPLTHIKRQVLKCVFDLLIHKPEQEANLLQLLIHKLGDTEKSVAALASQSLLTLILKHHPAMKPVVCEACRLFLQKETTPLRAHYYTLITLNQMPLSEKETHLVYRLIDFYFERIAMHLTFTEQMQKETKSLRKETKKLKKKKSRQQRKGKLIIPLPPPSPSASDSDSDLNISNKKHKKKVFFDDESADEEKGEEKKKKKVLSTISSHEPHVPKKTELKQKHEDLIKQNKLLSALLTGLHRALPFLTTLTTLPESWLNHVNQLFRWTHHEDPLVQLHALHVLFLLKKLHPDVEQRFYTSFHAYLLNLSTRPLPLPVQSMFLTLFQKLIHSCLSSSESTSTSSRSSTSSSFLPSLDVQARVTAFLVRALDMCLIQWHPGFVIALLGLIHHFLISSPWLKHSIQTLPPTYATYQAFKRVPEFLPGTPFFHLHLFLNHVHPSIRFYVQRILKLDSNLIHQDVPEDPLQFFSLVRFLDTFAQKKPKALHVEKRSLHEKAISIDHYIQSAGGKKEYTLDKDFFKHYEELKPMKKKKEKKLDEHESEKEENEASDLDSKEDKEIDQAIRSSMAKEFGIPMDQEEEEDDEDMDDDFDFDDEDMDDDDDFSDDDVDDEDENDFDDEDDEDEDENEEGSDVPSSRRSNQRKISSVPLSGSPFASAQAYSELLESNAGLDEEEDEIDEDEDDHGPNKKRKYNPITASEQFKKNKKRLRTQPQKQKQQIQPKKRHKSVHVKSYSKSSFKKRKTAAF